MPNGNPFYIQQADIAGPVLGGLSAITEAREQQDMFKDVRETFQTGTPDEINLLSMKYPEQAQSILAQGKFKSEQTKQNYLQSLIAAYQNPEQIGAIAKSSVDFLRSQGASPDEIAQREQWEDRYNKNPEMAKKAILNEIAFFSTSDQWERLKGLSAFADAADAADAPKYQKTGAFLVRDQDTGEKKVAVGSFNPADGTLRTESATFENFDILSKLGETAGEETIREVGETRGITRATGEEQRAGTLIARGILAAESSAVIRRGLELLETVETGGIDAAALAAKKLFGVEGADEGELSRSLGKAVLAQLRETFGAQFTEREGSRLERLEAGFGKSVANNKRILQQTLKIIERTARRAMKAAERGGDIETANDIQDLLEFTLSTDVPAETDVGAGGDLSNLSDEELMRIVSGGGL